MRLLVLLVLLIPKLALAENEIVWYSFQQPPAAFLDGENQGQGYLDKVREAITSELPQYQHYVQEANIGRLIFDIKKGKNVCFPALIKTEERQQFVHYSSTSVMQYNVQVVMKKSLANRLKLKGSVNLESLFSQHQLMLATVNSRSYTTDLDTILNQHSQFIINSASNSVI